MIYKQMIKCILVDRKIDKRKDKWIDRQIERKTKTFTCEIERNMELINNLLIAKIFVYKS